ncbi:hypothetical protein [Neofamilia massiliensis]|uniref:hypothetical protein n=1 Tax=Neofamilia massiliensis TaxID=1673724 RepID=UPI0012B82BB6|nr:hypothetical protein [Neofamilia massiliensis]
MEKIIRKTMGTQLNRPSNSSQSIFPTVDFLGILGMRPATKSKILARASNIPTIFYGDTPKGMSPFVVKLL